MPGTLAFVLAMVGVLLALVTGWLGGELVDRLVSAWTLAGGRRERA